MKISPITDRPKAEKIAADAEFLIVQKKENGEKGTFLADAKKLADHISPDEMKEQADRAEPTIAANPFRARQFLRETRSTQKAAFRSDRTRRQAENASFSAAERKRRKAARS